MVKFKSSRVPIHANRLKRLVSRHEFPSEGNIPIGSEMFPPLEVTEDELNDNQYGPPGTSDKPNHESQSGGGEPIVNNLPSDANPADTSQVKKSDPKKKSDKVYPI